MKTKSVRVAWMQLAASVAASSWSIPSISSMLSSLSYRASTAPASRSVASHGQSHVCYTHPKKNVRAFRALVQVALRVVELHPLCTPAKRICHDAGGDVVRMTRRHDTRGCRHALDSRAGGSRSRGFHSFGAQRRAETKRCAGWCGHGRAGRIPCPAGHRPSPPQEGHSGAAQEGLCDP
jgi:hypothetical protein